MSRFRYTAGPSALFVGIDPGENTGVAIWDDERGRFLRIGTKTFWDTIGVLDALASFEPCPVAGVVIEDSRSLPLFARYRSLPREARDRVARAVGGIDRQIDLLVAHCETLGLPVDLVVPSRSKKLDADAFRSLTGYDGRASQHARDAGILAFNRAAQTAQNAIS